LDKSRRVFAIPLFVSDYQFAMRLLRLNSVYPDYWKSFYSLHPEMETKSYVEQLEALFYDAFYQSDSFSYYLKKLGYECEETIANPLPLQKQWAKENDYPWHPHDFERRHALEMARRFQPEIVFLNNYLVFNGDWVRQMKEACPKVRLVLSWCAVPLASTDALREYDVVLTSSPALLSNFQSAGYNTVLLRHAFDPRFLDRIDKTRPKSFTLSFIGSILGLPGMHHTRAELVERLLQETDVSLFCRRMTYSLGGIAVRRVLYHIVQFLRNCGLKETTLTEIPLLKKAANWAYKPRYSWQDPILKVNRGEMYGLAMLQTLADSYSTLNVHIDAAGEYSGNIRMFEGTGVGTCLLTDWKKDLSELFDIDREVVAYRTIDECIEKAKWLQQHPKECEEIGLAAQIRTLRDHSYANRSEELDLLIKQTIA
jgi:spore maturation protein CgeB